MTSTLKLSAKPAHKNSLARNANLKNKLVTRNHEVEKDMLMVFIQILMHNLVLEFSSAEVTWPRAQHIYLYSKFIDLKLFREQKF